MENTDIQTMINILKKVDFFKDLDEKVHAEIIKRITLEYFPKNHLIFKEGDQGDCMYIIKNGIVRIFHAGDSPSLDQQIAMLADNDFFGEMALISEKPRMANAQAMEETQAFKLSKDDLKKLLEENETIAALVSKEFLDRFKVTLREN